MKSFFLKNPLKIKNNLSSSFSNASEWINGHILAILHAIKKSKCHFISHVILVQKIYKRSCADKMAAERCQTKDGLSEKEGAELLASYMVSSLTYKKSFRLFIRA